MPPATAAATCPNCNIPVRAGLPKCPKCKLEVSKFAPYRAAMEAAQKRGKTSVQVISAGGPALSADTMIRVVKITKLVVLLALVVGLGWLGYHYFGPKPPRYATFPATAQEAATKLMTDISGDEATFDQAYFLVADSARSSQSADDRGDYMQMFHILNAYLSSEIGSDWITQMPPPVPDPADPNLIIAKVGLETIHIHTAQQTPPDQMAKYGPRYGIVSVDELPMEYAADLRRDAFVHDAFNFAGPGAVSNWDTILGATASNRRYPPFIKKMLILQALRNPRAATWKSVVQADPFRTDPVVQARLQAIVSDDRYDVTVQNTAKEVLTDKVSEEEKAAVGL